MAFYHKYRAKTFGEMVGQEHVTSTLLQSLKSGTTVHSYVLTGPRGIGKTSVARLLAKSLNCLDQKEGEPCNKCQSCKEINEGKAIDIIEIDAASHTGVDNIREVIEQAKLSPIKSKYKVYIIDEVHMLSKSAFNALLKTLEEPRDRIVFIMATTEIHKVPETVLSRSQRFDFRRASIAEIEENIRRISKNEKISIDDESINIIAKMAAGAHRDAVSLLEKVSGNGEVSAASTRRILGLGNQMLVFEYIGAIFNSDSEEGLKIARQIFDSGIDMSEFVKNVVEEMRGVMVAIVTSGEIADNNVSKLITGTSLEMIVASIEEHLRALKMIKETGMPLLALEMAIVKLTSKRNVETIPSIPKKETPKQDKEPTTDTRSKEKQETKEVETSQTVCVPVVEMNLTVWQEIIREVHQTNSTLAALLRDVKPLKSKDGELCIGAKFEFHKSKIMENKNCIALEQAVEKITGKKLKVFCHIAGLKPKVIVDGTSDDDLQKAAQEIFS